MPGMTDAVNEWFDQNTLSKQRWGVILKELEVQKLLFINTPVAIGEDIVFYNLSGWVSLFYSTIIEQGAD